MDQHEHLEPDPTAASSSAAPGLHDHLDSAYDLLRYAAENSAQLPADVLVAINGASRSAALRQGFTGVEEETRFWNAYSLLFSNRLADQARRRYRLWLYVVLATLLATQIYYLAGSLIVTRLARVEDEWQGKLAAEAGDQIAALPVPPVAAEPASRAPPAATAPVPDAARNAAGATWERLRRVGIAHANYDLGIRLLPFFHKVTVPPGLVADTDLTKAQFMTDYMKLRAELETILLSLSGYILPFLYGLLGAFAYVFRRLSDPVAKLNFATDTWSSYNFRLHVGALGGLAVGWFVNGNQPISGVGALSPLALAFAAGYGSDLLFAVLDRVVGAFTSPSGLQTGVKTETTQRGGMTITTEMQRQAKVSGTPTDGALAAAEAAAERHAAT